MLRAHIGLGDDIGVHSQDLIRAGKLVPDDLVNDLIKERLQQPDARQGVILDGYPRTINQAGVLLHLLQANGFHAAVVHLIVDYEKIVARLSGRRQCPVCGTLYSLRTNPPRVPGFCDLDGSALVIREDDRESVIRERLREYDRQTVPILEFFRRAGVQMIEVEGGGATPEQIMQKICGSLNKAGLLDAGMLESGISGESGLLGSQV